MMKLFKKVEALFRSGFGLYVNTLMQVRDASLHIAGGFHSERGVEAVAK